jgi:hypothetical protein
MPLPKRLAAYVRLHFEAFIILLVILGIVLIGVLVTYKVSFLNFFFLPVILAGYYLGKKKAVLLATLAVLLVYCFYLYKRLLSVGSVALSLDDYISLLAWGGFLILTGALLGTVSDERERKIDSMQKAYVGVLGLLLNYFEVADEEKPPALRLSLLAGMLAKKVGMNKSDVENVKSAALLIGAGEVKSNVRLFEEVAEFIRSGGLSARTRLGSREQVLLNTTACLLKEIEPLLAGYVRYYVEDSGVIDKDLAAVPRGSGLIALAVLFDRLRRTGEATLGAETIRSFKDLERLAGRAFPEAAVQALREAALVLE